MRRRRRPHREIAFSFDSFLDVVANVVGIILRLIVVAWVGARSYKAMVPTKPLPPLPALVQPAALPEPTDPRAGPLSASREEVAHCRQEVRQRELSLLEARQASASIEARVGSLTRRREGLTKDKAGVVQAAPPVLPLAEMARRAERLQQEVARAARPTARHEKLQYRVPISVEAQDEEAMFEIRKGRVTLLDAGALQKHIREAVQGKSAALRDAWSVTDVTPAVGEFRARYTVERERQALEPGGAAPPGEGAFRYGASGWVAEPVREERGEPVEAALAAGSAFRQVIDALDAKQTVVTLWVYPDSFAAYRRVRDHLHEKGVVVAGRPLPEGAPIGASPRGTASRGQ